MRCQGKVVFLAPTRPLVNQQIEACYRFMGVPKVPQPCCQPHSSLAVLLLAVTSEVPAVCSYNCTPNPQACMASCVCCSSCSELVEHGAEVHPGDDRHRGQSGQSRGLDHAPQAYIFCHPTGLQK